jgi:hypothetical protein
MEILGLKNKLQLIAGDEQDVIVKMRDAITAKSESMVVPRQKRQADLLVARSLSLHPSFTCYILCECDISVEP